MAGRSNLTSVPVLRAGLLVSLLVMLAACAPEVGSEGWCKNMQEKPKGDWSTNEAIDYAEHCLLD